MVILEHLVFFAGEILALPESDLVTTMPHVVIIKAVVRKTTSEVCIGLLRERP